jgi:uncharacterized protein (UPF0128 family)
MGEIRNAYKLLFGKPDGKRPFWITRLRREDSTDIWRKQGARMWTGFIWLMVISSVVLVI